MRRLTPHRSAMAVAVALPVALILGFTTAAGAASTASSSSGGRSFPGASGSVAAITGSSMEVQNQLTGQVTVSWTTSTTFSHMATVPASSVAVGDCVTVSGSTSKKSKVVTAKTVTISKPTSGKCSEGFGGFPGGGSGPPRTGGSFPGGGSGGPPSGESAFGRQRPGGFANIGFASGKVKSVNSNSMKVSGFSSASLSTAARTTKGKRPTVKTTKGKHPTVKTTTVKVTLKSSTTYSESESATSSSLAAGDCVTATGSSDSTGAVSASAIQITSTGGKTCNTGFGGFGGSGGPSGG